MASCTRLLHRLVLNHGCRVCYLPFGTFRRPPLYSACVESCAKVTFRQELHTSTILSQEDATGSKQQQQQEESHLSAESKRTLSLSRNLFKEAANKSADKETFYQLIRTFGEVDKRRRGHLQFIETALKYMPHFNVEKDINAYNKLLDIFPKGVYVAKNVWQVIFNHFPEQQTVALKVLQKLEDNKIMPNNETKKLLLDVFGRQSHPVKKYQRIMYWFPKFRNINPFPLPFELPSDPVLLSELGLKRICEYEAELTVVKEFDDSSSDTNANEFLTSSQSPEQKDLLSQHPPYRPLFVEGPFNLWLRDIKLGYYVLRSDAIYLKSLEGDIVKDEDEEFEADYNMRNMKPPSEDQLEGSVYAMCMTSNGSQERLNLWIKKLQEDNPHLARLPVIFNLFDNNTESKEREGRIGEGTKLLEPDT
ncbi:evolutionarily conserved signaling intermediate in Toll pathway, mitochondrial-like [Apostichopus japonicus]|uniref:evolutionarily conserved signaling intermediate in Toll pathway, mitochondrial-like n=1 Tax=Stichopus japonicus TaxID=307972 RepID=UPI003AB59CD4